MHLLVGSKPPRRLLCRDQKDGSCTPDRQNVDCIRCQNIIAAYHPNKTKDQLFRKVHR